MFLLYIQFDFSPLASKQYIHSLKVTLLGSLFMQLSPVNYNIASSEHQEEFGSHFLSSQNVFNRFACII